MQDNSGIKFYKMPEAQPSLNEDKEEVKMFQPDLKVYNSHEKNIYVINATISALMEIRTKLEVKRVFSSTISRREFTIIVDEAKENANDLEVSKRLDEVFEEYLVIKNDLPQVSTKTSIWNNEANHMVRSLEQKTDQAIADQIESGKENDDYSDGETKGSAKTLRDGHFKSNASDVNVAA